MKTAVVYARYSCDRQNEQSIDGQLRVCNDYAEKNDIIIVDNYIDKAMSGTNDDREAFQRMLKDSDKQTWDYVLVYKLDRFSRNKFEMAIHRKHLKDNGIKLVSVMENIPDGPEGILLESLLEGMNQYYSEELSQKTKRGMNETRLKGNFIGGFVNYGYYRKKEDDNTESKKLYINEDEASILRQIFTDYANGVKISDIVRKLNSQGITNKGSKFLNSTVREFLLQEKYTGIYKLNGQVYDKVYPKIIDEDLYELVRRRLDKTRYGNRRRNHATFLLRNKTFCGYCGSMLHALSAKNRWGNYRYYKCSEDRKNDVAHNKTIKKDDLENIVNKAIMKAFNNENSISAFADAVIEVNQNKINSNSSMRILKADLDKVSKSINNIMNAIEQGIITETTKSRLEELEKQKREITEKIIIAKTKEKALLKKQDIIDYIQNSLKQCPEVMIDLMVNEVKVYREKIEIKLNYTKVKDNSEDIKSIYLFTEKLPIKRHFRGEFKTFKYNEYKVYITL